MSYEIAVDIDAVAVLRGLSRHVVEDGRGELRIARVSGARVERPLISNGLLAATRSRHGSNHERRTHIVDKVG